MSCLMNFGEINIPSSRAFWDDCDEDEAPREYTALSLDFEKNGKAALKDIKLLLILEGKSIKEFSEQVLLQDAEKVCSVPNKMSLFLKANSKTVFVIVEEDLNVSGELTELLLPYAINANEVITLNIKPKVEYKSTNIEETVDKITFIRQICGNLKNVPPLQAPNLVSGVTAGIASYLKNKQPEQLKSLVVYTDCIPLDKLASQPLINLLQKLGINCKNSFNAAVKETSHLYS